MSSVTCTVRLCLHLELLTGLSLRTSCCFAYLVALGLRMNMDDQPATQSAN